MNNCNESRRFKVQLRLRPAAFGLCPLQYRTLPILIALINGIYMFSLEESLRDGDSKMCNKIRQTDLNILCDFHLKITAIDAPSHVLQNDLSAPAVYEHAGV